MRLVLCAIILTATIGSSVAEPLLSRKKANAICERVLSLANAGKLGRYALPFTRLSEVEQAPWRDSFGYVSPAISFDLNADGAAEYIGTVYTGGSCYSDKLVVLRGTAIAAASQYLPFTEIEVEQDELLRWAKWGARSYLMQIEGEPIVVSGRLDPEETKLHLVSWFREGIERPLCAFTATGAVTSRVVESANDGVCRAVARGKVSLDAWERAPQAAEDALRTPLHADEVYRRHLDVNMDGTDDEIALAVRHSGAGCGSLDVGLRALTANGVSASNSALDRLLLKASGRLRYGKSVPDFYPRLFTYAHRPYLLGRGDGGVLVSSFWQNTPKQWCRIQQTPQFKIQKFYPPRSKSP